MLSWLAKRLVSHTMARAREGDLGPTLRLDAKDIRFRFPGESRWSGELEGKENLERVRCRRSAARPAGSRALRRGTSPGRNRDRIP